MKGRLWLILDARDHRNPVTLGRVRANNSPAAILAGYRKFKIAPAAQRYITARPVKPLPPPAPLDPETVAALRGLMQGINRKLRDGG